MPESFKLRELLYSVGSLEKTSHFFCDYGKWDVIGDYQTDPSVIEYWQLDKSVRATEKLICSGGHETGQIRLISFKNVDQKYIRSSQNPWDTGGIMDINLKVHSVAETFNELREIGWHGLSDPLFQTMGPFKLHDILMKGYDDIIVAFTHPVQPPVTLKEGMKLPTHVYNSSITVNDLEENRTFYEDFLGFHLMTEYEVTKDGPQENMFGLPFNIAHKAPVKGLMFSIDGTRDCIFQVIKFKDVTGKDFADRAIAPNRGLLAYRVEINNIVQYHAALNEKSAAAVNEMKTLRIEPYGEVTCFTLTDPNAVIWEFFETK